MPATPIGLYTIQRSSQNLDSREVLLLKESSRFKVEVSDRRCVV